MLQPANYPTEVFGTNLYIHLADKADKRPWLCINQIPTSLSIQTIEEELKNKKNSHRRHPQENQRDTNFNVNTIQSRKRKNREENYTHKTNHR